MTPISAFFDRLLDGLGFGVGRPRSVARHSLGWFNLVLIGAVLGAVFTRLGTDLTSLPFVLAAIGLFVELPTRGLTGRLFGPILGAIASGFLFALVL